MLQQGQFSLDVRKQFFTARVSGTVLEYVARGAMGAPFLMTLTI